ncbi:MAG TPA: hypothetical protein DD412_07735, partial [Holosporales bacterium]|nr:hypothetical protein [Holosporales bacterium]
LMVFLRDIISPEESLDQRAIFNKANAIVALADLSSCDEEKRYFYHEAYYIYTLLSKMADQPSVQKAASNNVRKLLKTKKIKQRERAVLEKAVMPKSEELTPIVSSFVESHFGDIESRMQPFLDGVPEMVLGFFQQMGIEFTEEMRAETLSKMKESKTREYPELLRLRKKEEEKMTDQIVHSMSTRTPGMQEKKIAITKPVPKILLKDIHLEAMAHLLGQVYLSVKQTPLLRGRTPVVIPVGRSVSWLVELHKMLDSTLKTGIEFRHILASGLRNLEPTTPQKIGYKSYLGGLGFEELEKSKVELIFLDVSETGQTLISIKAFVEELFPGLENHTQHFAILYGEETTDLPCARIAYMPNGLRPIMFAKHNEKQHYCPHPTFYPHDWETPEVIGEFRVPKGALEWEERMKIWAKGEGAAASCRKIQAVIESEGSL